VSRTAPGQASLRGCVQKHRDGRIRRVEAEAAIQEIIDRETQAWNSKDVSLLLSVFHPDMVWAWPATYTSYDPVDWRLVLGKFDAERWGALYEQLFRARTLVHNHRETVRIEISEQGDGAFAVVDIDTLWRENATGFEESLARTNLQALCARRKRMENDGAGWSVAVLTVCVRSVPSHFSE